MEIIPVEQAVGMTLGHDITKIIPGREKCRAFKRGHVITAADIPQLCALGKEHVYVWEQAAGVIHEDEAAIRLAAHAAGPGLVYGQPNQGKVNIRAAVDGLLKVQVEQLDQLNRLPDMAMATLHNNRAVSKGTIVAGTRIIPLTVPAPALAAAEAVCGQLGPLLTVKPFQPLWVGVITSGSEVYSGRIKDGFYKVVQQKLAPFGARLLGQVIVPDDAGIISQEIHRFIAEGAQLVLVTGGMSVDPDDVTPSGIRGTGADVVAYGSPVLPGSMFMLAYLGRVPVCGLPGCVMFNRTTVFDLILPRLFTGELINKEDIVKLGHGGLCSECAVCRFPACSFGKAR